MEWINQVIQKINIMEGSWEITYVSPLSSICITAGVMVIAICGVVTTFAICRMYIKNK